MSSAIVKSPIRDFFMMLLSSVAVMASSSDFFIMIFCSCSKKKKKNTFYNSLQGLCSVFMLVLLSPRYAHSHCSFYTVCRGRVTCGYSLKHFYSCWSQRWADSSGKLEMVCFQIKGWKKGGRRREEKIKKREGTSFWLLQEPQEFGGKQNACQDWRSSGMGIFWHGLWKVIKIFSLFI